MFDRLIQILAGTFRIRTKTAVESAILAGAIEGVESAFAKLSGQPVELPREAKELIDVEAIEPEQSKPKRRSTRKK